MMNSDIVSFSFELPFELRAAVQGATPAQAIINEIAFASGITAADILGYSREHQFAHPRQEAMRQVRERLGFSWNRMARVFKRDHSTCISGVRAARARLA